MRTRGNRHGVDAFRGPGRGGVGGGIADGGGVEHHHVSRVPDLQRAALLQAEVAGGQAGHLPHRGFQQEQANVAAVVPQHARERAPQAWVRALAHRDAVRADHGLVERQDALHVVLVHQEMDGAARLKPARRFFLGSAPFAGSGLPWKG